MTTSEAREVLGVGDDPSPDEIKTAYRRLVTTCHPDRGGSADLFRRVSLAYQVLSAPPETLSEGEPQDSQTTSQDASQDASQRLHPLVREVLEHVADDSATATLERLLGSRASATQVAVRTFLSVLGADKRKVRRKTKKS